MNKRAILFSLIFGLIPSWFLYKIIYDFYHDQAVWAIRRSTSHLYSGGALKVDALENLVFYIGMILLLSYFTNAGGMILLGGKGSAIKRVKTFFTLAFNPTILIISFLGSVLYLPLVFLIGSAANPW